METAKEGVAATDAGIICAFDVLKKLGPKPIGDAKPDEAVFKRLPTIFALGGAGLTITALSTKNIPSVGKKVTH